MRVAIRAPLGCEAAAALRPDDVDLPEGMSIKHICSGGRYEAVIEYEGDILTLKNTVDDVLRCLKIVDQLKYLNPSR
ncbi:MAG: KEOPS complex subunit Pcc1 [Thermoproteus sp. AZ2]|jgi:hypothetical protein|uniref:KEOPS complex subunit Pcc1 n=1 Tax=Thermoproteus sp. AZ2 TaxID=1609232 RepID=A0ACC6UZA8_9CREN|nr:MAG: KEOPS complex Pcc1-like subunit [Thermoproteus sp. AZ2]